jgi:hypothetical protein
MTVNEGTTGTNNENENDNGRRKTVARCVSAVGRGRRPHGWR